jgi:hypothetical protein
MEIPIKNKSFLKKLDTLIEDFYRIKGNSVLPAIKSVETDDYEQFISRERLDALMSTDHRGDPVDYHAIPIGDTRLVNKEFIEFYNHWRFDVPADMGMATCALINHYPEKGLTGWHTNWNANAYQILFTWSKTGDGYFCYLDKEKNEIVKIQDKPGWQCRWFYFGRKDEPEHHCWHACYTESERFTLAYKFSNQSKKSEQDLPAQEMRDELIEEISTYH